MGLPTQAGNPDLADPREFLFELILGHISIIEANRRKPMKHERRLWSPAHRSVLPIATATLAVAIFIFDTVTDLEIAGAVLYVAVVLISIAFCRRRGVVLIAIACSILTLLSFALTPTGSWQPGLVNGLLSLIAIAATTYLALKIESADVAAHEARAQLTHMARVMTLGELTASIAHEVNQPLAAVVTSGNACQRWLASQPPNIERASQALDRIVSNANRASEIIGRVRNLVKKAPSQLGLLSINEVAEEVIALMQNEAEQKSIVLYTRLAAGLPAVSGDRIQLQQVLLNLMMNAIEAVNACIEGPREIVVSSTWEQTNGVVLAVSDTGKGLAAGMGDEIFDAFQTTKPDGMGMGLAVSRSIAEAHGGRLWVTPNAPRGAIFHLALPASGEPV